MEGKIKSVTAVNALGSSTIEVGQNGVSEIVERILEYEDHVDREYIAYDNSGVSNVYKRFINLPVEVEYFLK